MFVCQYSSNRGCLEASALLLPPICYTLMAPTLEAPIRTWNGAKQHCQSLYPEGTLAYSYIYPESEVIDYISQTLLQSGHSNVSVWIGIRRHPWVWVTESSEIPFTYTHWWSQEGASVDERCAHLDLRQDGAWADKACSVLSQYFVCEQEPDSITGQQTVDSQEGQTSTTRYQETSTAPETGIWSRENGAQNAPTTESKAVRSSESTIKPNTTKRATASPPIKRDTTTSTRESGTQIKSNTHTEGDLNHSDRGMTSTIRYGTDNSSISSGLAVSSDTDIDVSTSPGTKTRRNGSFAGKTSLTSKNIELIFIIIVVTIGAVVITLVIGANVWDTKRAKRKKTKDIYFGPEDNSSGESKFNAAFCVENGITTGDKSTISHINIGRINTMALKGNSVLLRDHETASLAINPAYSSFSEQDPEENFKCPDVISGGLSVGCNKDENTRASGSSNSNSLIQSLHHSDVSYGGHMEFKDSCASKAIQD